MAQQLFGVGEGAMITRQKYQQTSGRYVAIQDMDSGTLWSLALLNISISEKRDMTSFIDADGDLIGTCLGEGKVTITMTGISVPGCISPDYPSDGLEVYRDASPADYRRVRVYVQSTDATGATGSMYYGFVTSIVRGRSGGQALGNEVYSLTIVAVAE